MYKCPKCHETHLSEEIPPFLSPNCSHSLNLCYPCVIEALQKLFQVQPEPTSVNCLDPNCPEQITKVEYELIVRSSPFNYLFELPEKLEIHPGTAPDLPDQEITVHVQTMDGTTKEVKTKTRMPVLSFKRQIQEQLQVEPLRQKLLHQGVVITYHTSGRDAILADFHITDQSRIILLIVMVDHILEDLEFHLIWGFPLGMIDYLDGSCFLSEKGRIFEFVDHSNNKDSKNAIVHSGDILDRKNKRGEHRISVNLGLTTADAIFFTLSSYKAPTMAAFVSPQVKLVDRRDPDTVLSTYEFNQPATEQAVVMCFVKKEANGEWSVFRAGRLSKGNSRSYDPLKETIAQLIQEQGQ
eukprot:TRINITY_DN2299_c1_g1_i1.p1 TRINITY_DN2299_c1_g1~~TRINITY_DN2299_c1_g1_i1.p1  ORF type:complete len:373 (-),score=54.46 TRINITY_DN2299_c1_g1_i1:20-1078(-)